MDRALMDYLPCIMQDYEEMQQIMQVEQPGMEALWEACDSLMNEAYVQTETGLGAKRWESILEISPKDTDTLEVRNFRIQGRLVEDLPYTYRMFERQLIALCKEKGHSLFMTEQNGLTLKIRVALSAKELKDEVVKLAERIVPCNIILDVELMYNTHAMLKGYTHAGLSDTTHAQLREKVFQEDRYEKNTTL